MKHLFLLAILAVFVSGEAIRRVGGNAVQSTQTTVDVKLTVTNGTDVNAPTRKQLCENYAQSYGWTAKIKKSDGTEIDNPENACAFVERHLEQHFLEVANSAQAVAAGEKAKSDERKKLDDRAKGTKTKPAVEIRQ